MAKKIKLVFCTDGIFPFTIGGMQRHSRLLIEQLVQLQEIEIVVIHPHQNTQVFSKYYNLKEIAIEGIRNENNYLLECYRYSKRVMAVLDTYPDSLIYSQGLCVWADIQRVSKRLIVNPHGLEPFQVISIKEKIISVPFKLIFKYIFKHSYKVISLGGKLTSILTSLIDEPKKIVEIPNAVNIPKLKGLERDFKVPLNILFVARFASNKGIHILIDAITQLNDKGLGDNFKFNLAGKGPLFEHYSTKFRINNVNYLGFVSDEELGDLFFTNDLFVLPTLFEGMPTVVLEAMSYQLPVIVSDVGATSLLVDNNNGYLITKNSVSDLKAALLNFMHLSLKMKRCLGSYSRLKVRENYTWDKVALLHYELLKNISV